MSQTSSDTFNSASAAGAGVHPFLDLAAVNRPYRDELAAAALRVIDSGRYIGGAEVEHLEAELAALLGAPHVVAVSNGLDALRLILRAYKELGELTDGDEVLLPANTYIASVLAVTDAGLRPVLVDADLRTMNLDTRRLEAALTPRTRAVMPVHLYGRVVWDERLAAFARRHDLKVVEDTAQAIGARSPLAGLHGSPWAGALGHAGALSFYPTKNVGALGDAGAVVTHDARLAATVRALANYGSDRRYHNIYAGLNCRMDPLQAALLRVKLRYIHQENAARARRAAAYDAHLSHPAVVRPEVPAEGGHVWHQYVVRVQDGRRERLMEALARQGIGTDIHYAVPPHRQPCYRGRLAHGALPVTERLAAEVLSLPIATGTTEADAAAIARAINGADF